MLCAPMNFSLFRLCLVLLSDGDMPSRVRGGYFGSNNSPTFLTRSIAEARGMFKTFNNFSLAVKKKKKKFTTKDKNT